MDGRFNAFFDLAPAEVGPCPVLRLQHRAKRLLSSRSADWMEETQAANEWLIEEFFVVERDEWIRRQVEDGGSILRFLDFNDRTERGLCELIDAYGHLSDIAGELEYPTAGDTSELEALEGSFWHYDLDDGEAYEHVAVLALSQMSTLVNAWAKLNPLGTLPAEDWPYMRMRGIAIGGMEIMETLCRAEAIRELFNREHQIKDDMKSVVPKRAEELVKKKISLAASRAASERHRPMNEKKQSVLAEWDATRDEYNSRADFARIVGDLRGIKERTLYEWIAVHEKTKA